MYQNGCMWLHVLVHHVNFIEVMLCTCVHIRNYVGFFLFPEPPSCDRSIQDSNFSISGCLASIPLFLHAMLTFDKQPVPVKHIQWPKLTSFS